MAFEDREEPEYDTRACEDTEANRKSPDADLNRIMAVDVEGLSGPEHDHGEEVGSRYEGDYQGQGKSARSLLQPTWEHGVFRSIHLPEHKGHEEGESNEKWSEDVS